MPSWRATRRRRCRRWTAPRRIISAALAAIEQLPESDGERSPIGGRIAQSFGRAGVFDPSRDQLAGLRARRRDGACGGSDRPALIRAEYWLGYINYALGEPVAAIRHYERALEAAHGASARQRLVVQIRAASGQTRQAACDYAAALPLLDEAIEAKRRYYAGAAPRIGIAYSLACKGFALGDMGRFAEAHAHFEEAMAAIGGRRRELEASVLDQRSAVCLWQGRMEEALGFAEAGRADRRTDQQPLRPRDEPRAGRLCPLEDGARPRRRCRRIVEATLARGRRPQPEHFAQLWLAGRDHGGERPHRRGAPLRRARAAPCPQARPDGRGDGDAGDGPGRRRGDGGEARRLIICAGRWPRRGPAPPRTRWRSRGFAKPSWRSPPATARARARRWPRRGESFAALGMAWHEREASRWRSPAGRRPRSAPPRPRS